MALKARTWLDMWVTKMTLEQSWLRIVIESVLWVTAFAGNGDAGGGGNLLSRSVIFYESNFIV